MTNSTGMDEYKRINVDFPAAAANAFATHLAKPNQKFRLAYMSGFLSERDQTRKLWVAQDMRHIRVGHLYASWPRCGADAGYRVRVRTS